MYTQCFTDMSFVFPPFLKAEIFNPYSLSSMSRCVTTFQEFSYFDFWLRQCRGQASAANYVLTLDLVRLRYRFSFESFSFDCGRSRSSQASSATDISTLNLASNLPMTLFSKEIFNQDFKHLELALISCQPFFIKFICLGKPPLNVVNTNVANTESLHLCIYACAVFVNIFTSYILNRS